MEVADLSIETCGIHGGVREQHTNESSDCQVPGLVSLQVVVRAVVDHKVVPESQVFESCMVNLAMGHEVQSVVSVGGCILSCG